MPRKSKELHIFTPMPRECLADHTRSNQAEGDPIATESKRKPGTWKSLMCTDVWERIERSAEGAGPAKFGNKGMIGKEPGIIRTELFCFRFDQSVALVGA